MAKHQTPHTDAAVKAVREAVNKIGSAVQADMDTLLETAHADLEERLASAKAADDKPAARRIAAAAAQVAEANSPEEVAEAHALADAPSTDPAPAVEPVSVVSPAVVAPAATNNDGNDGISEILNLLKGEDGLVKRTEAHHQELYTEDGISRIGRLEHAVANGTTAGPNWPLGGAVGLALAIIVLLLAWAAWNQTFVMALGFALFFGLGAAALVAFLAANIDRRQH